MKSIIMSLLSKFNLKIVRENTFNQLLIDSKYRALYEILKRSEEGGVLKYVKASKAERFQDILVISLLNEKKAGYFVEFGAADGIFCSNTYMMEKELGWSGVLAEPAKIWHQELLKNRNAHISDKCVYKEDGHLLEFSQVDYPGLSTITKYSKNDDHASSRSNSVKYKVNSITLEGLLQLYSAPIYIDYLAIDTEGSEYDILRNFNFEKYNFGVIQVEHNNNIENKNKIKELMVRNGYFLLAQNVSSVDDFYLSSEVMEQNGIK